MRLINSSCVNTWNSFALNPGVFSPFIEWIFLVPETYLLFRDFLKGKCFPRTLLKSVTTYIFYCVAINNKDPKSYTWHESQVDGDSIEVRLTLRNYLRSLDLQNKSSYVVHALLSLRKTVHRLTYLILWLCSRLEEMPFYLCLRCSPHSKKS